MRRTNAMKEVVLYHANCPDGFGAAYAAWTVLGDSATYLPVQYGQLPPGEAMTSDRLYILDFSYDRETILGLVGFNGRGVTIIDHHKTARTELEGLESPGLEVIFDLEKSGAVLAWEYFHPNEEIPDLLRYVQDRDLWRWKLPLSRQASAALGSLPKDFQVWDFWKMALDSPGSEMAQRFFQRGVAILDDHQIHVESLAAKAHWVEIAGYRVPVVNSPLFQSEIGEELCRLHPEAPFAAVFFCIDQEKEVWTLRSRGGFDVSQIATLFDGGGHVAASGFVRLRNRNDRFGEPMR